MPAAGRLPFARLTITFARFAASPREQAEAAASAASDVTKEIRFPYLEPSARPRRPGTHVPGDPHRNR